MKILLINKSYQAGGAAIAARRLWNALKKSNESVNFLIFDKISSENDKLIVLTKTKLDKIKWWFNFIFERLYFLPHEKNKSVRFAFSPAITGENISKLKSVKEADIVHLHWFNQGFLSIKNLKQLIELNKPIVWTLHDMWAFTGGCHYNNACYNYTNHCGNCIYIKNPTENDLSRSIYLKKENIYRNANITFVTCSDWLKEEAQKSSLLSDKKIVSIPNPIDTNKYFPSQRIKVRKQLGLPTSKKLIVFGAANLSDPRKGLLYLVKALEKINHIPDLELVLFGKDDGIKRMKLPLKTHFMGSISLPDKIIQLYQSADLFVLPSLQDNLPNTVMESMACGTPVVAFSIGGIPQMIDHKKNGYLTKYKSSDDLANGIKWVLNNNSDNKIGKAAREKVIRCFSEEVVARQYAELYKSLINDHVS